MAGIRADWPPAETGPVSGREATGRGESLVKLMGAEDKAECPLRWRVAG